MADAPELTVDPAEVVELDEVGRLLAEYGKDTHRVLTAAEEIALAKRIERGDLEAKDELVGRNLGLVLKFAGMYREEGRPVSDYMQFGTYGLIRAAEKFDWRRGIKFSTYAVDWVRQATRRGMDETGRTIRLPVHMQERMRALNRAERKLEAGSGRTVTVEELAEELGKPVEAVEALQEAKWIPTSLDAAVGDDGNTLGELVTEERPTPEDVVLDSVVRTELATLIKTELMEDEQLVIYHLYFNGYEGDRQALAKDLGKTVGEVKEIEKQAIGRLSELMTGEPALEAEEYFERTQPPETLDERRDAVWNLKQCYPDMTFKDIGKRIGITARQANADYRLWAKHMPELPD